MKTEYPYNPIYGNIMIVTGFIITTVFLILFLITGEMLRGTSAVMLIGIGFMLKSNLLVLDDKHCEVSSARFKEAEVIKYEDITKLVNNIHSIEIFTGNKSIKLAINKIKESKRQEVIDFFNKLEIKDSCCRQVE